VTGDEDGMRLEVVDTFSIGGRRYVVTGGRKARLFRERPDGGRVFVESFARSAPTARILERAKEDAYQRTRAFEAGGQRYEVAPDPEGPTLWRMTPGGGTRDAVVARFGPSWTEDELRKAAAEDADAIAARALALAAADADPMPGGPY
jgi:hypothetical protein